MRKNFIVLCRQIQANHRVCSYEFLNFFIFMRLKFGIAQITKSRFEYSIVRTNNPVYDVGAKLFKMRVMCV